MELTKQLERGLKLVGKSMKYTVAEPLYPHAVAEGQSQHIWLAYTPAGNKIVLKAPRSNTTKAWSAFQTEVEQQQRFQDSRHIRRLLDVVESSAGVSRMVLEHLPQTLWEAREKRSLSIAGIRKIMKDVLEGVEEMHANGWIHLDIKAQNILLGGEVAKLADLGSAWAARPPSKGIVQTMPYRSPEVLFGMQWSMEADIWSWGMVYLHMIQAIVNPNQWGLYDRLPSESTTAETGEYEQRIRHELFHDFQLYSAPLYQGCKEQWPTFDLEREGVYFRTILTHLGIGKREIGMLEYILNPMPKERPSAREILQESWLDDT